ncbi:MAG: hypothetical protein ACRDHF_05080 [Tepidiformaceae bacterium]
MGALVDHLEEMLGRGSTERELVQAVEDELSGGDLLDDEIADEDRAVREAAEREHELQRHIARASGRRAADRETLRLTPLYAHRGGLYLPGEAADVEPHHDPGWRAREAVRFSCFAVIARLLVHRLESGAMPATDYASAVSELATRLSRIPVHVSRRRR